MQEVKKPPYTKLRGNVWWYRREVPEKLRSLVGCREFAWSLETTDMETARTRAAIRNAEVAVMLEAATAKLKAQQSTATPTKVSQPLTQAGLGYIRDAVTAHVLAEDETVRIGRPELDSLDAYESIRADQFEDASRALITGRAGTNKHDQERVQQLLTAVGVHIKPDSPAWPDAAFKAVEGLHKGLKGIRDRIHGEYISTPSVPQRPPELEPQQGPAHVLRLGHVIDEYLLRQEKKKNEYTRKVRRCLQLFGEMVGRDLPVRDLRQRMVTDFLHDICSLPAKWAHRFDKGEPITSLLSSGGDKLMAPATYHDNYRVPLGKFLTASRRDHGDEGFPACTVEGIEYTGTRKKDEDKQRALTPRELRILFEGPEFRAVAADPDQECLYWFSVVMLFTGARPREVCQVNPLVDVVKEGDHWGLRLDEGTTAGVSIKKSLKTKQPRLIPLHSELVRLGFPAYVDRLREQGADRLFPAWRVKQGNPYTASGVHFSNLLRAVGLYTKEAPPGELVTGAYVLRKTFITQCRNQGVISKEITGHSDGTTTPLQERSYITGPEPFQRKLRELEKLVMPVEVPLPTHRVD